jgi:hypothetical protein
VTSWILPVIDVRRIAASLYRAVYSDAEPLLPGIRKNCGGSRDAFGALPNEQRRIARE